MEDLFLSVLNMSLTASYVIAAVMLVRLFLKKAPKAISYALWAVAGFRLVFPFSFESVFSLLPFKSAPIPADISMQPIPRVDSGIRVVDNVVSSVFSAGAPTASVNPLQLWLAAGAYLWLAGIAVMLVYSVVSIVLLKRRLNGAMLIEDNIYKADNLKTPFVLGLFRPEIYVPAGLSDEEYRYIILHERTHIRRHDHVVKYLAYFILCLHWFNPLVWAAFLLMSADMEMSCDERVLKEMGSETKKAYSMSLLSLAAERRIIGGSPLAFGEGNIKGRIKNILNFKRPAFWVMILSVAAVILAVVCLLTNPVKRLELPDAAAVLSMEMEQFNVRESLGPVVVTDSSDIETVLSALSGARKTLRQSVNDAPIQSNYLKIRLILQDELRTLFLYTEGNAYYIEEPYIGVYRSSRDASVAIYKIYTGSGGVRTAYALATVYAFDKVLYINPATSYYPIEGTGQLYLCDPDGFTVVNEETGEIQESYSLIDWQAKEVDTDEWDGMFLTEAVDISDYKTRMEYDIGGKYRLCQMDGAVWLGHFSDDILLRLYRLKETNIVSGDIVANTSQINDRRG
ncbi:MAG: DUF5301 domain-containing protein [Ruminiclostridium sp.]